MSAEGDQQRRPGAPDDTDGKRRLRAVSYPDPYLVTKLPLEGTVNSGVIRLGERMLLGFIHRPYPDGTRVRVVYDEWLFAERIEEPERRGGGRKRPAQGPVDEGGQEAAEDDAGPRSEEEPSPGGVRKAGGRAGRQGGRRARKGPRKPAVDGGDSDESAASGEASEGASATKSETKSETGGERGEGTQNGEGGAHERRFPEEFSDPERKRDEDRGEQDAWTDAFGREDRSDDRED